MKIELIVFLERFYLGKMQDAKVFLYQMTRFFGRRTHDTQCI